ncbi:MAG: DUF956 family protein [Tissierellia bacterium]|nr:DUF956 family protein [Tissierellia bacterium]
MAKSQNTKVDFTIKATSYLGINSYGDVMIGDNAFEYYNEKNVEDYIQIPWEQVDYISASVLFKRKIVRFAIFTKSAGHFSFSTRDNKKTLQMIRKYIPLEKMHTSPNLFDIIKNGLKAIYKRIFNTKK